MPIPETQALIDEWAKPSIHTEEELRAWAQATAKLIRQRGQQTALMRGLVQEAEEDEPDQVTRGKMESIVQQLDAQALVFDKIAREVRKLRGIREQLVVLREEFGGIAEDAGYTVP